MPVLFPAREGAVCCARLTHMYVLAILVTDDIFHLD